MTLKPFSGAFGSGTSSPHSQEDNMFSTDVVEVILGISEGPIKGLKDGAKTLYAGDTPFRAQSGSNNLGLYEIKHLRGREAGANIIPKLGGAAISTTVSTNLAPDVWVPRLGQKTFIDFIDVRVVINRLAKETDKGSFENTGKFQIQYRKEGTTTWRDIKTLRNSSAPEEEDNPSGDDNAQVSRGWTKNRKVSGSPDDRQAFWQNAVPATTDPNAIWFDSGSNHRPKKIVSGSWVNMPGASQSGNDWLWTQASTWGNDRQYRAFVNKKKPKTAKQGDFWLRVDSDEEGIGITYFYNGNSWVIAGGSLSPGGFGTGGDTDILPNGIVQVDGRISSPMVKEFRIPVDNYNGKYEIRMKRVTPADTDEKFFDVTWESFQEITAGPMNFPGLATTQIVINSSDQFSSLPDFWGIYQGRTVRVPSNYNPVTRNYTGVWDGTWKIEYSNNPAFVGYDLIRNDRYGMNAYYDITMDEMDIYEFGKWCDVTTADGTPRFTFNGLISNPLGGREAINYIFGIGGGRFFDDGNGKGVVKFDDQGTATMLFGPENVEDGLFIYSFTDIMSRTNDITVTFTNPKLNWQTDRRRVFDQDHIDAYGRIPLNFEAVGCTSAKEAIRRARYKLSTSTTEVAVVSFKTNRVGLYATPYDVILIADPDVGNGLSGRVLERVNATTLKLRDAIYLEPGFNYTMVYQSVDVNGEYKLNEIDLVNGTNGSITSLPLQTNIPSDIPEFLHFGIRRRDGSAAPKAFRIISIGEIDNDPDKIEIQAIEINRQKWAYIDGIIDNPADEDTDPWDIRPEPPAEIRIFAKWDKTGGAFIYTAHLDWDRSPTKNVMFYRVYYSRNNGPWKFVDRTTARRCEINHLKQGEYQFKVVAVNNYQTHSDPIFIEHRLVGQLSEYNTPENLRLIDQVSTNTYNGRSPVFGWDPVESGRHDKYVIQVVDPLDPNTVFATYKQQPRRFRYEYDDNRTDHSGTPARQFRLLVMSQDDDGDWSDAADLIVNNPAPPVLSNVVVEDTAAGAFITFDEPTKRDYKGVVVYASTTSGFTPGPGNLKYQGRSNNVRLKLNKNQTWYIKLAAYDEFGTTGLNMSTEYAVNTDVTIDPGDIPDGAITSKGTMSIRNKNYVSLTDNRNWTGNVVKTKYTESVVLDTFTAKTTFKSPIEIAGNLTILNRNQGTGQKNAGNNVVESELILEYQAPGTASWKPLQRVRTIVSGGGDAIATARKTDYVSINHQVKDTGNHKYRLRLKVYHKRAYTAGLTKVDVNASGGLTFVWLKK